MKKLYSSTLLFIGAMAMLPLWASAGQGDEKAERLTIALRSIGHKVLLESGDSTSRVLPVQAVGDNVYRISFEKPFALDPNSLFDIVTGEMQSADFPPNYVVSVIDRNSNEVLYTYGMPLREGASPPCIGRVLPKGGYYITIHFIKNDASLWYWAGVIPIFILCGWHFSRKRKPLISSPQESGLPIGPSTYYPEQQRLVVKGAGISLTAKEAKVLHIFAANINQEIPRERLQKEVWEDDGVIVGRSLDMFVSRLRKKFEDEPSVQIINIHGKGYKLVVDAA